MGLRVGFLLPVVLVLGTPAAAQTPRDAASIECSKRADALQLHGKERSEFRAKCKEELSGRPITPQERPTPQRASDDLAPFLNGRPFIATTERGSKLTFTFRADGSVERAAVSGGSTEGRGTWRRVGDQVCTTWTGSKENCFTFQKTDQGLDQLLNGTRVAKWAVPGSKPPSAKLSDASSRAECTAEFNAKRGSGDLSPDADQAGYIRWCLQQKTASSASLEPGAYVYKEHPCSEASNANRLNFDGKKFTGSKTFCLEMANSTSVKSCRHSADEEPDNIPDSVLSTFKIVRKNEFFYHGTNFRLCNAEALAREKGPQPTVTPVAPQTPRTLPTNFMVVQPTRDFVIMGPDSNAFRDMFQTMIFNIPTTGMSGHLSCRQNVERNGIGFATVVRISNDARNNPIFLNQAVLNDTLSNLKQASLGHCKSAVDSRKLLDFDTKRPVDTLPSKVVIQSTAPCFFAYGTVAQDQFSVLDNCVVVEQNRLRAQEEERQRMASAQEAARIDRANKAARSVLAARQQFGSSLDTQEGRDFIAPIVAIYRGRATGIALHRVVCSESYEYVGGNVLGKSIEGNVGVILVNVVAVNKSDTAIGTNSWVGNQCGNPSRELAPGDILNIEVKGLFRKYDTGWRFERILE